MKHQFDIQTLQTLCETFDKAITLEDSEMAQTREYKAMMDILHNLFIRLKKKSIDKQFSKKPFVVKMQYYEAYHLSRFLLNSQQLFCEFEQPQIAWIATEIDQKL